MQCHGERLDETGMCCLTKFQYIHHTLKARPAVQFFSSLSPTCHLLRVLCLVFSESCVLSSLSPTSFLRVLCFVFCDFYISFSDIPMFFILQVLHLVFSEPYVSSSLGPVSCLLWILHPVFYVCVLFSLNPTSCVGACEGLEYWIPQKFIACWTAKSRRKIIVHLIQGLPVV